MVVVLNVMEIGCMFECDNLSWILVFCFGWLCLVIVLDRIDDFKLIVRLMRKCVLKFVVVYYEDVVMVVVSDVNIIGVWLLFVWFLCSCVRFYLNVI